MLELLFLGTGAAVPSKKRSTSCIAVRSGPDIILLDCGEGSQRQLMLSPFSFMKIRTILITHMHGDHVFGLPGLLQTMGLNGRRDPLTIYGPPGLDAGLKAMLLATEGELEYDLKVVELEGRESFEAGCMTVTAYPTDHGIASMGFVVREHDRPGRLDREKAHSLGIKDGPDLARLKNGETVNGVRPEDVLGPVNRGLSVSYTGDTRPTPAIAEASKDVDVLVHESSYMDSESELAQAHFHSTVLQAAGDARDAGARCLVLTHFSNRYDEMEPIVEEARTAFPGDVYAASDFDFFEIKPDSIAMRSVDPALR